MRTKINVDQTDSAFASDVEIAIAVADHAAAIDPHPIYSKVNDVVISVNDRKGAVTLSKSDVGLSNVDNTSDVNKPVSTATAIADSLVQLQAASDATTKANVAQANAIAASAPVSHVGSNGSAHAVVSTTVNGFMLAADKVKLDAISGTNTGDETTATIRTKLGITTLSGNNTGDQTSVTGNAGTATVLQTARTIAGIAFNGSANIAIPYANLTGLPTLGSSASRDIPATGNASSVQVVIGTDTRLTDARAANGGNAATVTTNANLTGPVTSVGNATAIGVGAITNAMLANVAVADLSGTNTGDQINITGNAATATKLATARTINGVSFDGSADITIGTPAASNKTFVSIGEVFNTATIAAGATTPTSAQGLQISTLTKIPAGTSSKMVISGVLNVDCNTAAREMLITAFRGTTIIGAKIVNFVSIGKAQLIPFEFFDTAFGTAGAPGAAQTYSLRFGTTAAATWYINRKATAVLGGAMALNRFITYEEVI